MSLISSAFADFVTRIKKEEKDIICYGAGMLPLYIEPLLAQCGLLERISVFVDGDRKKEGKTVSFQGRRILIKAPDYLKMLDVKRHVILITAERYPEILERIGELVNLDGWECYAWPLLNLSYFKSRSLEKMAFGNRRFIPKVIHFIWFGQNAGKKLECTENGEKESLRIRCMESWKKYCPHYEIRQWDETNYDVHKNRYIEQAYERKKWAYVSDYVRLDVLYQYGGVYLDTDVELFRSPDALLRTEAFLCFGEWPAPNSGAGMGCVKGHPLVKEMMETREEIDFIQEDGSDDPRTNSNYEMQTLMRHGFTMNFDYQLRDGMALYPPDVIAPASVTGRDSFVTGRSIGIHHCNNSWRSKA